MDERQDIQFIMSVIGALDFMAESHKLYDSEQMEKNVQRAYTILKRMEDNAEPWIYDEHEG